MRIIELVIDKLDDLLGFEATALVNQPAIETDFYAFSEEDLTDAIIQTIIKEELFKAENFVERVPGESQDEYIGRCIPTLIKEGYDEDQAAAICYASLSKEKFESYNDYPESASNAARRALEWRDSHPDQDCGTAVGWARANQLAKRENISEDTIARMASFKRHQQHKDVPYSEGCGGLMWDAWGGTEGIEWASRKLKEIRGEDFKPSWDDLTDEAKEQLLDYLDTIAIDREDLSSHGMEIVSNEEKFAVGTIENKPDDPTALTAGSIKILFYYDGPVDSKNRDFCSTMMKKYKGKLFRKEDIDKMSTLIANPEFGAYDIFEYKGSFGCRHSWKRERVYMKKDENNDPYVRQKALVLEQGKIRIGNFSADVEQQMVTGPLMIPNKLILRIDENGDPYFVYFSEETIQALSEKMMKHKLLDKVNLEHDSNQPVDAFVVENWIITDPETDKSKFFGFDLPKGTWMATYKIEDPKVWAKVKSGEVKGFSIEGFFQDRYVQ